MKEPRPGSPRPGLSRRGLLGIFGRGLRELRPAANAAAGVAPTGPQAAAAPGARAPAWTRRVRPASEVVEGTLDPHGRLVLDLAHRPLAVGGSLRVDAVGFPIPLVLVRVNDVHFAACATTCPCDGSDVLWSETADVLWCPSCGSRWTLDGRPARGPATAGLRSFVVQEAEGAVRILSA